MVTGNSEKVGSQKPKFTRESMKLLRILSGTTHFSDVGGVCGGGGAYDPGTLGQTMVD